MKKLHLVFWSFFCATWIIFQPILLYGQNAPITTAGSSSACPDGTITVPVTVSDFSQITAVSLRLDFDPTLLNYTGYSNLNALLPGSVVNSIIINSTLQEILIVWSDINPQTLANGSKLLDLNFTLLLGSPVVSFNNTANGGGDCEYADAIGNPLNDLPTETYYNDAEITNLGVVTGGSITGVSEVCQGQQEVAYSVQAIANATGYIWILPTGASIAYGNNTNSILVNYSSYAISGDITVQASNSCGNGPISTPFLITVSPLPEITGAISGPNYVCQNSADLTYSISPVLNALAYTWTVPVGWTITDGQNTTSITVNSGSLGGSISVTPFNNCSSGNISVLSVIANSLPIAYAGEDQIISYGASTVLNGSASGSGPYEWSWDPGNLLINPEIQNPTTINLASSTLFNLLVTDANGCVGNDDVLILISGGPLSIITTATPGTICSGNMVQLLAIPGGGTGNYNYSWSSDPAGFTSSLQNPTDSPIVTTTYIVTLSDGNDALSDNVTVDVNEIPSAPEMPIGPDSVDLRIVASSEYNIPSVPNSNYYFWELDPDNAGIMFGSDTVVDVVWDPDFLGLVSIKVKSYNECGQSTWSSEKQTFLDNSTGLGVEEVAIINISPNPNCGRFHIKSSTAIIKIDILDLSGKVIDVIRRPMENQIFEFNLANGIYMALIYTVDNCLMKRIIVISGE